MGHGSRKLVYDDYGDYVDGLENEYEDILKYMGREFAQVKVRGERDMLSSPVMTGLETFSDNTFGESSGESQKQNPVYPIEYTGLLLGGRDSNPKGYMTNM